MSITHKLVNFQNNSPLHRAAAVTLVVLVGGAVCVVVAGNVSPVLSLQITPLFTLCTAPFRVLAYLQHCTGSHTAACTEGVTC